MVLFSVEQQVDGLANQVNVEVALDSAQSMVSFGEYAEHFGLLPGVHYRKVRGNGCYHLRVTGGRAFLHWDKWDPRRFLVAHFFESPALWVPVALSLGAVLLAPAGKR